MAPNNRAQARTPLKVCCISNAQEAALAVASGADALGLVSAMPSGPGVISDRDIADIARAVPPGIASVLLTARTDGGDIAAAAVDAGVSTVQIVAHVEASVRFEVRRHAAYLKIIQVVHVEGDDALRRAGELMVGADALLLDSGRPGAGELGGTGRVHDWRVARAIVETLKIPVYLAGGLTPENVGRAIARVRPFGVDVCSGLRRGDRLDPVTLSAFTRAMVGADRILQQ
ncbi:MAG: phosphoribosylanthranilate isomerase [Hyphomicrobiales bacterium]